MGSVRIFRKSGIGLDYYKGKEFMSRVVVRHPEIKSPNQVKTSDVTNYWDDYLGSNQTNIHPRTGLLDNNRIFSADGTKSIRFGNHEMDSMGTTKFHFHLEEWKYDPVNDVMDYFNTLVRIKE